MDVWESRREKSVSTLGKMKPLLADKLVVSLLAVERDVDATAFFFSVLGEPGWRRTPNK